VHKITENIGAAVAFYTELYTKTINGNPRKDNSRIIINVEDMKRLISTFYHAAQSEVKKAIETYSGTFNKTEADRDNWRKQALSEAQRYDILIEAVWRMLKAGDAERKAHEQQMLAFTERKAAENAVVNIALAALEERKNRNGGEE